MAIRSRFKPPPAARRPLSYQWLRNGETIPAATANSFTLPAVGSADHLDGFSLRVSNASGAVTSAVAVLTVDFGLPGTPVTNRVLNYSSAWRYNQTENLDGSAWYDPGFDDSAWPAGPGLLAAENNSSIVGLVGAP